MSPVRNPTANELFAAAVQSAEGTEAVPATADVMAILNCALTPNQENLLREDKGLGRSRFGYVRGGNQSASWEAQMYAVLAASATPVGTPPIDAILRGALGAAPVSINTTVSDATPAAGDFDVASATGIQVGDILSVLIGSTYQMRPVSAIASLNLTFSPAFTAAPANGAVVKARLYRAATTPVFLTLVNWLRDTADANTAWSRKAIDAVVGELELDFNSSIVQLTARGPAARVTRASIPSIPSLPSFATQTAQSRNFGDLWISAALVNMYEFLLRVNNNAVALPVPFGQEFADGAVFGARDIEFNAMLDANDANVTQMTNSENKSNVAVFGHIGDDQGLLLGFNMPRVNLSLGEYEKGAETVRARFSTSKAFASSTNNEIVLAVG